MDRRLLVPGILAFLITLILIAAVIYVWRGRQIGNLSFGVQTTTGMAQSGSTNSAAQAAPTAQQPAQVGATAMPATPVALPPATPTAAIVSITAVPPIEVATAAAPVQPIPTPLPYDPPSQETDYSNAPCNSRVTHIVRGGENLFRIALQYRTTAAAVARLNNITNVRKVSVGRRLQIVVCGRGYSSTRSSRGATYVVQTGDTIFRIALRYGINTQYLCRVNGLYSNLIVPGQTLIIP
jgi:LysM repeat protein